MLLDRVVTLVEQLPAYAGGGTSGRGVRMLTEQGEEYRARRGALVTASVGVLQSGSIRFTPPMADGVARAVADLEMGHYCKVFVSWASAWQHRAGQHRSHAIWHVQAPNRLALRHRNCVQPGVRRVGRQGAYPCGCGAGDERGEESDASHLGA